MLIYYRLQRYNLPMKRICTLLFFAFIATSVNGQSDLDNVFDDEIQSEYSKFSVGINAVKILTGTPMISVGYIFLDKIQVKVGAGITPFGFIFDLTDPFPGSLPVLQRNLSMGSCFSAKFRYFPFLNFSKFGKGGFAGVELIRWDNGSSLSDINYTRTKCNINGGLSFNIYEHIDIDLELGISIGFYSIETPLDEIVILETNEIRPGMEFFGGFNTGISINYNF